MLIVLAKL